MALFLLGRNYPRVRVLLRSGGRAILRTTRRTNKSDFIENNTCDNADIAKQECQTVHNLAVSASGSANSVGAVDTVFPAFFKILKLEVGGGKPLGLEPRVKTRLI